MVLPFTETSPWSTSVFSTRPTISLETAHDTANLLTRNLDLHAIGMGHCIGLLGEFEQRPCNSTRDVQERQVTHFLCGPADAIRHLPANGIEKVRMLLCQFLELTVAELGNFTFGFGLDPGPSGGCLL